MTSRERALQHPNGWLPEEVEAVIDEAVAEMKERCAKVAETHFEDYQAVDFLGGGGREIAQAIRALT